MSCTGCNRRFPVLDNRIPVLVPDPETWLEHWGAQLRLLQQSSERVESQLTALLNSSPGILTSTQERLTRLVEVRRSGRQVLDKILKPLDEIAPKLSEVELARLGEAEPGKRILYHWPNVLRDWCWGDEENQASLGLIQSSLAGSTLKGNCLVLGAGACRLAADLHVKLGFDQTLALDWNPLLLLTAHSVLSGTRPRVQEIPVSPLHIEKAALTQELQAPPQLKSALSTGLQLICGNALRPPIPPASMDIVVTPWLIDVIQEHPAVFFRTIHAFLKPAGTWIHFGPLGFQGPDLLTHYCIEEILEFAQDAGFEPGEPQEARIPYLASPHSGYARSEKVISFAAKRARNPKAALPAGVSAGHAWLKDTSLPIPMIPEWAEGALKFQSARAMLSLIDGQKSIESIAAMLAEYGKIPKTRASLEFKSLLESLIKLN